MIKQLENLIENELNTKGYVMYKERDTFKENTLYVELQAYKHVITIEADDTDNYFRLEVRHHRLQRESGLKHVNTISQVRTYIRRYDRINQFEA